MCAQGQAADGESCSTSPNPSHANQKMQSSSSSSRSSNCQRVKRCCSLEPVLEHCELAGTRSPSCVEPNSILQQQRPCPSVVATGTKPRQNAQRLGILSRLRDGYVKLMNEVASGADFAGVSSFYGAGYGTMSSREYATFARNCSKETKIATSLTQSAGA